MERVACPGIVPWAAHTRGCQPTEQPLVILLLCWLLTFLHYNIGMLFFFLLIDWEGNRFLSNSQKNTAMLKNQWERIKKPTDITLIRHKERRPQMSKLLLLGSVLQNLPVEEHDLTYINQTQQDDRFHPSSLSYPWRSRLYWPNTTRWQILLSSCSFTWKVQINRGPLDSTKQIPLNFCWHVTCTNKLLDIIKKRPW